MHAATFFCSPIGQIALLWHDDFLMGLRILEEDKFPEPAEFTKRDKRAPREFSEWQLNETPKMRSVRERLQNYFANKSRDLFSDVRLEWEENRVDKSPLMNPTPFQVAIWKTCRRIEFGEVWTYGKLAAEAGFPRAIRAVGSALARNPTPLIVPCHRVIRSDGAIGNFSAPGGAETKKWLLALEKKMRGNS